MGVVLDSDREVEDGLSTGEVEGECCTEVFDETDRGRSTGEVDGRRFASGVARGVDSGRFLPGVKRTHGVTGEGGGR